jgi:hypothetical protein
MKGENVLYMIDCFMKTYSLCEILYLCVKTFKIFIYHGLSQKESWGEVMDQQKNKKYK